MKPLRLLLVTVLAVAAFWPRLGAAQGQKSKELLITARNLTAEAAAERGGRTSARPGDEIGYTLDFTNVTGGPVRNVQLVDSIPQGTTYVLGSAAADRPARINYSIDGGKTYTAQPMITAIEDGKKVEKPAPRELYTHVRWTVLSPVAPGARVMVQLRTQVNAAPGEAK